MSRARAFAWLCAATLAGAVAAQEPSSTALVATIQREQEWFCSISAPSAALDGLVQQVARGMQFEVEGLERISPTALVTVELRDRPVAQALDWMLGSANLCAKWRTGVLQIQPIVAASPTVDELRTCALAAYAGALRSFPDPEAGAAAVFAKASILERRGDFDQALASYDSLVRAYPQSKEAPEALMRAARRLHARGDWAAAGDHYADLLRLSSFSAFVPEARLGFAKCMARQGEHKTALRLLSALDTSSPAATRPELHERLLARARCVLGEGDPAGARALLRETENGGLEPELEAEWWELSARALPSDAPPEYAASVWLEHARRAAGVARADAVAEAARLTRLAGDELGALWIDRWAQQNGAGHATAEHAHAAREALGLDARSMQTDPVADRLGRAERLLGARLFAEAQAAFAGLREQSDALDEAQRARVCVGMARCLDGQDALDAAIAVLRDGLGAIQGSEARREVFLAAAALLEQHGRVDDAIEAYRGRL